ncbi:MAG: uridylate kinase, partial [Chloroflexaceae bacterium]|nr:uridylate kinase [Chloroflexaceae bacterium]
MTTFMKFGGSVITNKRGQESPDLSVMRQLAQELSAAVLAQPELALVLGHGSGSFGHTYAARYGIHQGLAATDDWRGLAWTAAAVLRLNRLVVDTLVQAE